jgi:hypothetical protein
MKKLPRRQVQARRLPRGGARGTLFLEVARLRFADATALFQAARYNCSIYIIGYAIECSLKWAATVRRGRTYLPEDLENHNWDTLLAAAGLINPLNVNPVLKAIYSTVADRWHPSLRYNARAFSRNDTRTLHNQFKEVFDWIVETTI